jgi:membrane-bound serine protease (ClpP class)
VNWGGIALIGLAFILFIVDVKVSSVALTIAGAVSFVLGSLLLFRPFTPATPVMPALSVSPWLLASMTALLVGFFTVAVTAGLRAQRRPVLMGAHVLIGKTGVAVSDLSPQGEVRVRSETWSAVAVDDPLRTGETIEVVGIDGLRLRVRRSS